MSLVSPMMPLVNGLNSSFAQQVPHPFFVVEGGDWDGVLVGAGWTATVQPQGALGFWTNLHRRQNSTVIGRQSGEGPARTQENSRRWYFQTALRRWRGWLSGGCVLTWGWAQTAGGSGAWWLAGWNKPDSRCRRNERQRSAEMECWHPEEKEKKNEEIETLDVDIQIVLDVWFSSWQNNMFPSFLWFFVCLIWFLM